MSENKNTKFTYEELINQGYTNAAQHPAVDPATVPAELRLPVVAVSKSESVEPSDKALIEAGRLAAANTLLIDGTSGVVYTPGEAVNHDRVGEAARH